MLTAYPADTPDSDLTDGAVVAIPTAVFYDHRDMGAPFVRFAFCKKISVLEEAARRLKGAGTH